MLIVFAFWIVKTGSLGKCNGCNKYLLDHEEGY
jgi:hypothetical protein